MCIRVWICLSVSGMMRTDSLCEQRGRKRKLKKEKGEEKRGRTYRTHLPRSFCLMLEYNTSNNSSSTPV